MTNPRKAFWESQEVSKRGGRRVCSHKPAVPALLRADAGNCKLETLKRGREGGKVDERKKGRMNVATKGIFL